MVEKIKKRRTTKATDAKPVRHPEFGRTLNEWMIRTGATNAEVGRRLGDKNGEKVARYRRGESMPRQKNKMRILADLIGITEAELRGDQSPAVLESMASEEDRARTEDEHRLLKAYRKMNLLGQKAIRNHAGKLLEQQGIRGPDNPFGQPPPPRPN